ncbi:MAG: hypothetical protein ACTSPG_10385 [Candidatus Hodarchaeales archaeon]
MEKEKFKPKQRVCKYCKNPFWAIRKWHKFCSQSCRLKYWRETHPYLTSEELAEIKKKLGIKE